MNARLKAVAVSAAVVLAASTAGGGTWTWDGGSAVDSNWTTAANWASETAPNSSSTTEIELGGSIRTSPVVDTYDPWELKSLTFKANALPFSLSGNALRFVGSAATDAIVNNGGNTHTIANDITLGGSHTRTILATNGDLTLNGDVVLSADGCFRGGETITVNGVISGAGELEKRDSGLLKLSRNATHEGDTTIHGGTLRLIGSGGLPDDGYVVVAPGGTWDLNDRNDTIFSLSSVFGVGGGTVDLGTGTLTLEWGTFTGTITGDGGLTKVNTDTGLFLKGANSHKGQTAINGGLLMIYHGTALGTADGGTTVSDGAVLGLSDGIAVTGETLTLNGAGFPQDPGALRNSSGDNTWDAQIVLGGDTTITSKAGSLTLKQAVGGPGHVLTLDGNGNGAVEGSICGGTDSVIKTGDGTWTLSGASSYLGPTTVRAGVLQLGEDNCLLDTSDLVITGGTFGLDGHDETLDALRGTGGTLDLEGGTLAIGFANSNAGYAGHITGDGNLVKWGDSTQTLTGRCTLRGELTIRQGILNVRFPLEPNRPSRVRVTAGTVLELEDAGDWLAPMTIDGTGISDSGAVRVVSGENSLGGITLAHHSTIRLESGTDLRIYGDPAVTSEGKNLTIVTDGDAECLIFGPMAIGAGTLTKEGTGSMDLIRESTHTGLTDVVAGTLVIWDGNSLGTTDGGTVVRDGAELELSPQQGDIHVGAESLRISGSGPTGWAAFVSRTGDNTWSGTVTLDADATIACNTDSLTLDACTAVTGAGRDLTLSGEGEGTISGEVDIGSGGIIKLEQGTWTLTAANPYTGTTTIDVGALRIEDANALGGTSHGTVVRDGGALEMRGDIHVPAEPLSLSGFGVDLNGALRSLHGTNSYAGDITLEANSMIGVDWGRLTLLGCIGESEPNLGFYKVGVGQLLLKESNLFTGFLGVLEGSVISDIDPGRLADSVDVTVAEGATYDPNGVSDTIDSLSGAGSVTLGGATLTLGGGGGSGEFSGVISEEGGIGKVGAGTQVLSGANTYTGQTTVTAGVLNVRDGAALGGAAGGTSVASGAALELEGDITVAGEALALSGTGVAGSGALRNVSGSNAWTGTVTLAGATAIQSDAGQLALSAVVGADHDLTLQGPGDGAIGGPIATGAGGLTKTGAGTWTLAGSNTYAGATAVHAGVLAVGSDAGLGDTAGGAAVSDGATLELFNDIHVGAEALTLNGSGVMGAGALRSAAGENSWAGPVTMASDSTIGASSGTLSLSGALGEAGAARALTKAGDGTLVLRGPKGYTGATSVAQGTLAIDIVGGAALSTLAIADPGLGAAVEMRQGPVSVSGNVTDGGGTSHLRADNGTMTLGGDLTVDNLRVGLNGGAASASVAGAAHVGASGDLDVARRTIGNAPTFGTLDLGAATSVTISVTNLRIGTAIGTGGLPPQPVQGTLSLSQAGSNTIHATTIVAGDSAWTDNTMVASAIHLGATNQVRADSVTIGGRHSSATADILAGGACDLAGRSGAKADLFIGDNITESGGIAVGLFDLTGGELDATLGELVLGRHGNGLGGGQGTLILDDGEVTADSVDMGWPHATGLSLAPQSSAGTLTMRGGDLAVGGDVTTRSGLGTLNLQGGSLTVGGNIATVASGPTGPGTMTINLHGGLLDLTGGSMDLGSVSPPSFSFTGGRLEDLGSFDDTLNQGILVMGVPQGDGVLAPGGSIGTTSIEGDYNLISGSLEIEIQSPGLAGGSDYDLVELTGPLSAAGLDGTLEVVLLDGYVPACGTTFDVVTAANVLLGPSFALDDSGAPMPDWLHFEANVVGLEDGQALQLTVVPEPAALSLLVLGGLVLLRQRRG